SFGRRTVRSIQRQSCVPGGGVAPGSQVPTVGAVLGSFAPLGTGVAVCAWDTAWSSLSLEAKTSAPATAVVPRRAMPARAKRGFIRQTGSSRLSDRRSSYQVDRRGTQRHNIESRSDQRLRRELTLSGHPLAG